MTNRQPQSVLSCDTCYICRRAPDSQNLTWSARCSCNEDNADHADVVAVVMAACLQWHVTRKLLAHLVSLRPGYEITHVHEVFAEQHQGSTSQ